MGSNLQGVCYVLDEPTIGLHPRDNRHPAGRAGARSDGNGNTLVVVEHDDDTIRRASHVIDIGPGAGIRGGRVVAQGTVQDVIDAPESVTGRYLKTPLAHPLQGRRPVEADTPMIEIRGARLHNLRSGKAIKGSQLIDRVLEVDQTPIGKDPAVVPGDVHRLLG